MCKLYSMYLSVCVAKLLDLCGNNHVLVLDSTSGPLYKTKLYDSVIRKNYLVVIILKHVACQFFTLSVVAQVFMVAFIVYFLGKNVFCSLF